MAASFLSNRENNSFLGPISEAELQPSSCAVNRICICLLCGLPGSGKTTLLRSLICCKDENSFYIRRQFSEFTILGIEYDAIIHVRPTTLDGYNKRQEEELNGKWKLDRGQVLSAMEAILQHNHCNNGTELSPESRPQSVHTDIWQYFTQIINLLNTERQNNKSQVILIIDDNMYLRSMRYEYYKLARRYQSGYCQIYVKCSTEKAMERNKNREEILQVPEEIIVRMAGRLEPPDPEKYKWETNSITVNTDISVNIDQILNLIQKSIMNPVHPLDETDTEERLESRLECSANLLHQVDLILRKCVATRMADFRAHVKPENLKNMSQHAFQVKKKIMCDLKDGHLPLFLSKELNITNSAQDPDSELFKLIKDIFLKEISTS